MHSCSSFLPRCLLLACVLVVASSARAFFPEPDPLNLDVGTSGEVKVNGDSGTAKVSLQNISIAPADGGVTHDLKGARNGTGFVNVKLTGMKPGNYVVTFTGKNNGFDVQGSITVIVRHPPSTSAQNYQYAVAGDPVNTRSGEYFGMEAMDLNLGGPMPLVFARYAASNLDDDGLVQSGLGANRSHNFASRILSEAGSSVKRVVLPSGRVLFFQPAGTKWVLKQPLDVPFQLVETGGSFLLGDPHTKQIWTYDSGGLLRKIEDGKGNTHTLEYAGGKLATISDGLGRVLEINQPGSTIESVKGVTGVEEREVAFAYTGGVLTSVTDYGGDVTTYGNAGGRPASVTRPEGNELFTQTYTNGKVTSQTERGTDTSTLDYQPASSTFTDPTGETLVDHYDESGNLTSHVDETGKAISMTYDNAGRRNSVTDRLGNKITILHHAPSGLPAAIINAEGRSILHTYKARTLSGIAFHDLVKITYPDGSARSFVYDSKGNVTQVKDQAGKAWKFTYNSRGQVLTMINPLGGITTNTYDAFGNLKTTTAPDVGTTTFDYDERHRLTQITKPGGAMAGFVYDTKDRVTSATDERGNTFSYAYDGNNRLTTITDPDNEVTTLGYDTLDRVTSVTDALLNQAITAFDSRRLLSTRTDGNGNTLEMHYDPRRRLTGVEDAGGQMWSFGYDDEGRMTQAQNPIDPPARRKLNKLGYPIELNDPLGNTRRLTRDSMQRVTQSYDPLGRLTSYVYDKRGLLISATEQGTGTVKYDRDALGNVTKITDANGGAWSAAYLKSGRIQKMTDPLGRSLSITYDARGRTAGLTFADSSTCILGYDASSHLTSSTFSAGPNLSFTYDDLGRLASANDVTFEHDAVGRLTNCLQDGHNFTATYDDGNRLQTVTYLGGGFTVTYGYDSRNRLTSVTDSEGTSITLEYDNAGRLTSQTRSPGIDGIYTYDAAGRLTRIQEGSIIDLIYTLNPASEVTDVDFTAPSVPSVLPATQLLKFGKAGEIVTPGYVYDPRGRLSTAPGGRAYQWDGASRLTNANGVILAYNGFGDIITRTEDGDTTRYYHHYALGMAPIVYEDPPSGDDRAYVWTPDGRLLYSVDIGTGDPTFYHFDRMGSTLALTDKNDSVTDSYAYGPFGESLAHESVGTPSTQPFTYIGAYGVRKEGDLYQMRARYYDPQTARFLSRDPLPPRLGDPKSTNLYAYAAQNPLLYLDPNGENDRSTDGFRISGSARVGLNDLDAGTPSSETRVNMRMRFNFDARRETDSGVTLGGRIRLQYDEGTPSSDGGGGVNAAYLYAEASGFRVEVGNANTPYDSLALLCNPRNGGIGKSNAVSFAAGTEGSVGADGARFGIFATYSAGDFSARVSYSSSDGGDNQGSGYNFGKTPSLGVGSIIHPAICMDALSEDPASGTDKVGFSYDLGGATIGGTIQRGFNDGSYADLGVRFSW